jgi:regulatory protein
MATPESAAYLDALKMLGRRELSEAQVRQRLARRGHDPAATEAAVARLCEERAVDDRRVAAAIARTQVALKGRGKLRVLRQIEQAGISRSIARDAADEVFGEIEGDTLLEAALARRLRGRTHVADEAERHRLYRYLVSQGFEPDRILRLLTKKQ